MRALPLVLTAGCRFGFGEARLEDALRDGTNDDVLTDDARPDAFVVCHTGAWSQPTQLAMVDTISHESDPTITADGLLMYYVSNRTTSPAYAIWTASRATITDEFSSAMIVPELDSAGDDSDPSISPDGLTIYFDSDRGVDREIWMATRTSRTLPFGTPTLVTITGEPMARRASPFVTPDGLALYYASGGLEIAYATRSVPSGPFTFVRELDEINAPQTDGTPMVSSDGLELMFESFRTGQAAIFRSTRASTSDTWGPETEIPDFLIHAPTAAGIGGPELSPDGRTLYLFLNLGQIDLYVSTRSCD